MHNYIYRNTYVIRPLSKDTKLGFHDQLSLNAGQKYCRMIKEEQSAILLAFIKLPFANKIFVLSIYEWPFYNGFTVVNGYAGVFSGASFSSYFVYASSEGPGESVSLCRLAYKQNKHVRHIVAFIKMLIGRRSDDPTCPNSIVIAFSTRTHKVWS